MTLPLFPVWLVDVVGSGLMIFFAFLCVRYARCLRDQDPNNIVWTYLLWLCYSLAAFAVSRSVGHIVKSALLTAGHDALWSAIKPYSGAVNTLMFVVVASMTLFFARIWKVYQQILQDKQALQEAHEELLFMNRNLENLAAERTQKLAASEKQLLQADRLASIGQLAAGIAHEINNPLGIILGYTQLLLRDEEEQTQRHEDLKIIEKHTRACKRIVGDLLSFARSTRTKQGIGHIHAALEEVLSVVQHHFELGQVTIERDFDPHMPGMVLDEEKIKQVFMNLVMNAKQAIGKKGAIRVLTHYDAPQRKAVVRIADTGRGIEPEDLPRLFDPFFTTKGTGEGTGLGLSVSYGIVKDHGGEILVESESGRGSTFTVLLPVVSEEGT